MTATPRPALRASRQGGWGGSAIGSEGELPIPNRDVLIVNNLIVNPGDTRSGWQHFAIYGPRTPASGSNIPNPAHTDTNLQIRGNVIWNGPTDWSLGLGDDSGCQPANPTCNESQLVAQNSINSVQPLFVDAAGGNYRLSNASALPAPLAISDFPAWATFTPAVPAGSARNAVPLDREGHAHAGGDLIGAYAAANAPLQTATPTPSATTAAASQSYLPMLVNNPAALVTSTSTSTATPTATGTGVSTATPTVTPTATPTTGSVTLPPGPITFVSLGDSLTEGMGDYQGDGGGYPQRVLNALQSERPGSTMLNLGRSGWTSTDLINGFENDPGQLGRAVTHFNTTSGTKVALLWIGNNDLWLLYEYGPEPMTDAAESENLETYRANVVRTVTDLRAAGAIVLVGLMDDLSKRPVVADPPDPAEPYFPAITAADRDRMSVQVGRYNAVLAELGLPTVDFFNTTIFTDPATLDDDGAHPDSAGYDVIGEMWLGVIRRLSD